MVNSKTGSPFLFSIQCGGEGKIDSKEKWILKEYKKKKEKECFQTLSK
jgi:hypothetical protein